MDKTADTKPKRKRRKVPLRYAQSKIDLKLDEKATKLVHQFANRYRLLVKAQRSYAQPWRQDIPLEKQMQFKQFACAIRVAQGLGADPLTYLAVQFKYFEIPNRYPYPPQLYSANSICRWNRYLDDLDDDARVSGATISEILKLDTLKLKRIKLHVQQSTKKILSLRASEFSKEFLQKKGVWEQVKARWLEVWGDDE